VAAFDDPCRALGAVPDVAPDLALLDIMMPGMDGRDLAHRIRETYRSLVPVVMLTARDSGADMAASYLHGASYYVTKPCETGRLLDVIDYFAGDLDAEEREQLKAQL
jgi:DNA-binding response OmpR family regulator